MAVYRVQCKARALPHSAAVLVCFSVAEIARKATALMYYHRRIAPPGAVLGSHSVGNIQRAGCPAVLAVPVK